MHRTGRDDGGFMNEQDFKPLLGHFALAVMDVEVCGCRESLRQRYSDGWLPPVLHVAHGHGCDRCMLLCSPLLFKGCTPPPPPMSDHYFILFE